MQSTKHANEIINTWRYTNSPNYNYFSEVDNAAATDGFWEPSTIFRRMFDKLDITHVCEIACGEGRHIARVPEHYRSYLAIDTSVDAIEVVKHRFAGNKKIHPYCSEDGSTIPCEDGQLSAVFSYDAMVHFEPLTMAGYLRETARSLQPGGRALFHHSAYGKNPTAKFTDNPNWRNYMTEDLMRHLASRADLVVLEYEAFAWDGVPNSDALTLFEKPRNNSNG